MPYSKRRCTGSPTCPATLRAGERYCPAHLTEYEKRRGTRQQRGYDTEYDRMRAAWQRVLDAGQTIICWRLTCDKRIDPRDWHLGHDDEDRRIIRGPECPRCNSSAAGRKGARARR